jgi:hypothetical protein
VRDQAFLQLQGILGNLLVNPLDTEGTFDDYRLILQLPMLCGVANNNSLTSRPGVQR